MLNNIRDFVRPNMDGGFVCPVCGTSEEKRVRLIRVLGTEEEGVCEAKQIHTDCLPPVDDLAYIKGYGVIALVRKERGYRWQIKQMSHLH